MTSTRRRRAHTDNDGCGAWGHVLNDAWRERLGEVDAALSKLGDPLRDPLKTVTGAEFVNALWQVPQHKRNRFLADLKVPAARRPSTTIEERVGAAALARMSRWKDDRLNSAVAFMTYDALKGGPVNDFAHAEVDTSTVLALAEECLDELLATQIPHGLLVAGLVAVLQDVAPGATLAAWLRRHPLPGTVETSGHAAAADAIGSVLAALPWEIVVPAEKVPGVTDADGDHTTASSDFDTEVEAARHAYADATGLTVVALEQLQRLRVPDLNGLVRSLERIRQAHDSVATAVIDATGAAGLEKPADDADLTTLIAAFAAAADATDPVRRTTRRLRTMELVGELGSCAPTLHEMCRAAEEGDPVAVELVHGLVRLADAKAAGATLTELSALDAQLRPLVPAELMALLLGIMLGQAHLTASVETTIAEAAVLPSPEVVDATAGDGAAGSDIADADGAGSVRDELEQSTGMLEVRGPGRLADAQLGTDDGDAAGPPPAEPMARQTSPALPDADIVTPAAATVEVRSDAGPVTTIDDQAEAEVELETSDVEDVSDALRGLVHTALDDNDVGLAYWLASAGDDTPLAAALKVATLAETLRGDTGPVADAAVSSLESLDPSALARDRLAALTALAAALRTTIVTGSPDAGAVLELLSVHVTDHVGLSAVAQVVATAAQRGALAGGQLRGLRDSSSFAAELSAVQQAAAAEMNRSRTVLLARASDMAVQLFAARGAVGSLLTAVVADDRRALDWVDTALAELSDPGKLKRLLDDLDREMRGRGGSARPLQGKARQKLNDWITAALEPVRAWLRVVRLLERSNGDRHLPGDLVALKDPAASVMSAVRTELAEIAAGSADGCSGTILLCAAVDTIEHLLAGQPPVGSCDGCSVDEVVGRALLRVPKIALDDQLRPLRAGDVTVDALVEAFRSSWPDVITARAEVGDFATARHAIAVAATGNRALEQQYTADLDTRLAAYRTRSADQQAELKQVIRRATWRGQLGDDDQIRLSAALESAAPQVREDLNVVDDELTAIRAELPALASAATIEITDHLQRLVEDQKVSVDQEGRVKARIGAGDLASADEILAAVEAGQDLPDPVTLDVLDAFFPAVPDALGSGLTREVINAVRAGTDIADCRFQNLPEETRTANAAALEAWHDAATTNERYQVKLATLTAPLRLAGIEARSAPQLPAMIRDARSPDRRFVDLTGVRVVGNAIVPAFGSLLDGKLRLLLVWGPQTPRSIVNWVEQDKSDTPVLVCLFGAMSADARRKLAIATAALPGKPVAVLDDAALTFLASRPEASITTTMQLLLPFATMNPYVPQAEGNVPTEMFYGRNHELVRLTGPTDSLVYGGRQLGKSALLRTAERRHFETGRGIAVYVSTLRPDTLWDALRIALNNQGVRAPGRERRDAYAAVTAAVTVWLEANPGLRLLVLIDECDDFFDLDAKDGFTQTTRLRDLRNQTRQRFKPVFAGLHEVARFASLPNQPFAHLGKPLPIGPLAPAEAFRLVTQPLATLGIRFEDDAAWRVLAYCNNQPILLQLVCQHLVNHVHAKRDEFTLVPYVITDDEFEQVWGSPTLVAEVSGKLKLTLDLDPRYGVVARVLGLAAHEDTVLAMSTVALREECGTWWPAGFAATTDDEFRALLIEMVTLGVLAREGANWALRSANVRRMLGASEDIGAWLLRADQATVPGPHVAGATRQQLIGARVAPLTEVQLADVIGQRNQLRIVLGSRATGADLIGDLLEHSRASLGRFDLIRPPGKGRFLDALAAGERGGKHRVVYSDVTEVSSESVLSEIEEAHHRMPGDGVTRSAVLYLGIEQAEVWLDLLGEGRGQLAADTIVACRRLDLVGLERWSHEQHGQFSDPADRDRLLAMTGGWPLLVDSVAAACAAGIGTSVALMKLRTNLDGELGENLLHATGLPDSVLKTSYAALVALGAELLTDETESAFEQVLADADRPPARLAALIAAGAVTRNDDGTLSLEPMLATLWQAHYGY